MTIQSVIIENITPRVDGGRYPIKRELGDVVTVSAGIYKDGHDKLTAVLRYRKKGGTWTTVPMVQKENFEWTVSFTPEEIGRYEYTIEAWPNMFATWLDEITKKHDAGVDVSSELLEGQRLIAETQKRAPKAEQPRFMKWVDRLNATRVIGGEAAVDIAVKIVSEPQYAEMMDEFPDKRLATEYNPFLELVVDRVRARFANWYEMFPRSQGRIPGQSGTFADCEARLTEIEGMGFNVIYFPPIHPIGTTNRKGPNNSLHAGPTDPGCPYAIGSELGGHKAVEPSLGTLADFERFVTACHKMGMEVALDFAINSSPDHPYVKEHPEWFYKRPDGTIKYAENPPKKYEDIYALDFHCEDRKGLWNEMKSIIEFWIEHGVDIFRVDNPHTKPVAFWAWMIPEIQKKYPQTIFLSEAFTHPKMMQMLAKVGFTQSYTYFTWRNHKKEITQYLTELTQGPMKEYYRGNFFTNTPDILPEFLQKGGRSAFKIRVLLAATLSSVYGIYSGFELCENTAIPGREEYSDSEKYDYKVWDWNRPGNIKDYIAKLNWIRGAHPALQEYDNLEFYKAEGDYILAYGKTLNDKKKGKDIVITIVNLDPYQAHEANVTLPIRKFGIRPDESYEVHDLLTNARYQWRGETNWVRLDPNVEPAHVFHIRR
uniref:Alpha-1,4-glucan:maltose-1-phosphate maltosyltransferase n=1 Tax=Candidatus Kentrum sp. MB TaxID=2138164 RepID=A0A451BBP2_9GAMM|nr:MAG: alpha-1,4-glucan:maltose-1-phosphate maltosyltransferase [Candidatus Kentron sp. MB]VFK32998.1 MAG: alpha-1,4-glucan:maltose-1-phosphate maltosyltransferase [Candidatus Kentron sp. MB]VFK75688.1 MAG: alpha-1,4-glucan:maltose-1-phosphate maltosyltransferase [Candidatus Kentron sp. MB]